MMLSTNLNNNSANADTDALAGPLRCPCNGDHCETVHTFHAPPEGEVRFAFSASDTYCRELRRCALCDHFTSQHAMDTASLYAGDYVSSNYDDDCGILRTFQRIVSLPPDQSDNKGRVRRVLEFAASHFSSQRFENRRPRVLDVGSGLCVFLHEMKNADWDCTALDPDERSARHAREGVGVTAIHGDFRTTELSRRYDVVTFNKVLEHLEDPVGMLLRARHFLLDGGFVFVELPDGLAAIADGPFREEFFIDHYHAFSPASVALLAGRAGYSIQAIERLQEPSSKYTLRAFMTREENGSLQSNRENDHL